MIRNGYEMMALDYARDQDTAEIVHDFMRGFFLPDADMLKRQQASREARKRNTMNPPGMSHETEDKGPRLYQATRAMSLEKAFEVLSLPAEWIAGFRASGEHFAAVRRKWRQIVLVHHPDRLPATLTTEAQQEHTAIFTKAMAAFEAIDAFYAKRHAPETPQMADEWAAAPTGEAPAMRAAKAREAAAAATAASATGAGCCSGSGGGGGAAAAAAAPAPAPAAAERKFPTKDKAPKEVEAALEATARAARPLLFKRRVRIVGLQAKPEHNGKLGRAKLFDRTAKRYGVELEDGSGTLKVKEVNLELAEEGDAGPPAPEATEPPAEPVPIG